MACAHRGCRCSETPVRRGGKSFCDERCASAETSGRDEVRCPCGHADCASPAKKKGAS